MQLENSKHYLLKNLKFIVALVLLVISHIGFCIIYGFKGLFNVYIPYYSGQLQIDAIGYYFLMGILTTMGFGMLLSYFSKCTWSGLIYTIFVLAYNIQFCPLIQKFWFGLFFDSGFDNKPSTVINQSLASPNFQQQLFRKYLEGVTVQPSFYTLRIVLLTSISEIIAYSAYIGRVNFASLAFITVSFSFIWNLFYILITFIAINWSKRNNQTSPLIFFDDFGTITVFIFGSWFALGFNAIYTCKHQSYITSRRYRTNRYTLKLAMIGNAFVFALFVFIGSVFPYRFNSQNSGQIIMFFGITASIIGTLGFSAILFRTIGVKHVVYGTLSGGVVIGSLAGIVNNISTAISTGLFIGFINALWYRIGYPWMNKHKIIDSNGYSGIYLVSSSIAGLIVGPFIIILYCAIKISVNGRVFNDYLDSMIQLMYAFISGLIGFLLGAFDGLVCYFIGTDIKSLDQGIFLTKSYQPHKKQDRFLDSEEQSAGPDVEKIILRPSGLTKSQVRRQRKSASQILKTNEQLVD